MPPPRKSKPPSVVPGEAQALPELRRPDVRNNFPDLLELRAYLQPPNDPAKSTAVGAELRVFEGSIEEENRSILVSLKALTLAVEPSGFDPAPGARLNEPSMQNTIEQKRTTTITHNKSGSIGARLAAGIGLTGLKADAKLSAEVAAGGKIEERINFRERVLSQRVKARPNLKWEVREPDGKPLSGSYLTGETLCNLDRRPGANQVSVRVTASVKQKDINFYEESRSTFSRNRAENTRDKLLNIFLAKSLSHDPDYAGTVMLSDVVIGSNED